MTSVVRPIPESFGILLHQVSLLNSSDTSYPLEMTDWKYVYFGNNDNRGIFRQ